MSLPAGNIGESAAKQTALEHAGVKESDTKYCNAWLEYDDGWPECYEVEFMAGSTRYEYEIALTSKTVLKFETKNLGGQTDQGETGSQGGGSSGDIGSQAAKTAALAHAGVSENQAYELEVERDYDDGRLEYEVEFKAGGMEYQYTIDGVTGSILEYEQDRDD